MTGQLISEGELEQLVEFTHPTCVSLYLPTDPTNPDPRTNSLAFKNLVNKAVETLRTLDANETVSALEEECERLLNDELFWKEQSGTFVLLIAGNDTKTFQLAEQHPELLMINDHYYLLPLIAQVAKQTSYYVLELDQEFTQMWRGDSQGIQHIQVPDLPRSVEEVTGREMNERNLQFHTGTDSPGGGTRPAMYHGSSSWQDDHDRYLEMFLHAVDKAVCEFLMQKSEPLLLSGVEEAVVMFKKISKCKNLMEKSIAKMPDPTHKEQALHTASWEIIRKQMQNKQKEYVELFEETVPAKRVTVTADVLRQAALGKVDTLLVAEDTSVWGAFVPDTQSTIIEDTQQPKSAELLNVAARLVLATSGKVVVLPADQMPEGAELAGILRY